MTSTAPPSGRYRKKPITLPAIRYRGPGDLDYVVEFVGTVEHFRLATPGEAVVSPENTAYVWDYLHSTWVGVKNGDWILRGVKGEFYPHDSALFAEVYDQVNDDDLSPVDGAAGIDAAEVAVRDLLESPTPRGVHYHTPRAIARAALTAAANAGTPALADILDSELPMDPLTSEEQDTIGRAVSKGYAEPYEAYRLGMQEGITAAYVRFTTVAEEETPK